MAKQKQQGVIIKQGPQPWAILQQVNGFSTIVLSGDWVTNDNETNNLIQVYARIVKEVDAEEVVPWTPCLMLKRNRWKTVLQKVPAGGLYRIETCLQVNENQLLEWSLRGDMIHHIGIGDLWVIAGQSNATGYGKGPVEDPPEMGIHLLRVNGQWDVASHPFNDSTSTLYVPSRERANPGHSPFLAFAKAVRRELHYPIGLIPAALGASPLKSWLPEEDGYLYRNMMKFIKAAGGQVKGVLWYQGCTDAFYHQQYCNDDPNGSPSYQERFTSLVSQWRKDLNDPYLPVLTVQLNRYTGARILTDEDHEDWGRVREMQRRAAEEISNVYVTPSLDGLLSDEIHNSCVTNLMIGRRLAAVALSEVYKLKRAHAAPNIVSAFSSTSTESETTICLSFENVHGELSPLGPKERIFHVKDTVGEMEITNWVIKEKHKIMLTLPRQIVGDAVVHGCYRINPSPVIPVDTVTRLPLLAFYGVPVICN